MKVVSSGGVINVANGVALHYTEIALNRTMKSLLTLAICVGLTLSGLAASTPASDPGTVAKVLYDFHFGHHFPGTLETMKANKRLFAPGFYAMLLKEFSKPVAKGDAPDIDWDVFLNAQETPDGFGVGKEQIDKGNAKVKIQLRWSPEFSKRKSSVIVILTWMGDGWKIEDFAYTDHENLAAILRESERLPSK